MIKEYRRTFTKTVWGVQVVSAESKDEAQDLMDCGDADEYDNKSEYTELGDIKEC